MPGAGGTTLNMYLVPPVRLIFLVGAAEAGPSVGECDDGLEDDTVVMQRWAVISMTPFSLTS